jgi:hypothetical protein
MLLVGCGAVVWELGAATRVESEGESEGEGEANGGNMVL